MIKFYRKYALMVLFVLMIMVQVNIFNRSVTVGLLYGFIILGAFFVLLQLLNRPQIFLRKSFSPLIIVWMIYLMYLILFDHTFGGLAYVVVKGVIFGTLMICIYYYYEFYRDSFPDLIIKAGLAVLLLSVIFDHNFFGGRYVGILGNANTTGALSSMVLGLIILKEKITIKTVVIMIFLLMLILASGSRGAILGIFIAVLLKNTSFKNIMIMISLVAGFLLLNQIAANYGITTGLNRTVEMSGVLAGRDDTSTYGYKTILLSPYIGHGLDKYAYIAESVIPSKLAHILIPNPHNSFLGMFIQVGIPLGLLILSVILYYTMKILFFAPKNPPILFLVIFPLISGLYESHLFSISDYVGFIFWVSMSIYLMYMYQTRRKRKGKQ